MRKSIAAVLTVLLMISFTGCGGDINTKINNRYSNLKSYTAQVTVTVLGNGKSESYDFLQSWKSPDKYRSEVISPEHMKGTISIVNQDGIWLKSADAPIIQMEHGMENMNTDYMFLSDFLSDYYAEENLPQLTEDGEGKVLLNAADRGTNQYRFTQNLWIDAKSNLPDKLITFDAKGNEMLRVEYHEFVPNAELDDSVFIP